MDLLRWGGPSREPDEPPVSELALIIEYRAELDGLALCSLAELRAAETLEAALSGLGPDSPVALPGGGLVGVPGCSGTVCGICGTSANSNIAPSVKDCETGGGGGGAAANDTATGEGNAAGIVGGGRTSLSRGVELAMAVPGFRMGNSSSSSGFGMGIGPDMRPRTD